MTLTAEQSKQLRSPFPLDDHEFNFSGYAYVKEEAISNRLDDVIPGWSFCIENIIHRADQITVHASIEYDGTTRHSTGMAMIETSEKKKKETGEVTEREANEAEKSATTDALKRCARLFGVGRYLSSLTGKQNPKSFAQWYAEHFPCREAWASKEAIAEIVSSFQEKTNTNASAADLATLAGIDRQANYKAWNDKYATDGDAKKAIWQAYQNGALTRIQEAEQSTMAELEEIAAESADPK